MTEKQESSSPSSLRWMIMRLAVVITIFVLLIYLGVLDLSKIQAMLVRWWTAAATVCFLASIMISIYRWQILLNAVGIHPGTSVIMRLSLVGYAFSTVIPGAVSGDIVKAYYVVKGQNTKRTAAVTTILLDRILGLFTLLITSAVAIGAVLIFMSQLSQNPSQELNLQSLGYSVITIASVMIVVFLLCLNKRLRQSYVAEWITTRVPGHRIVEKLYSTVYSFREKRTALIKATIVSFLGQLPLILCLYFLGRSAHETVLGVVHYLFLAPVALILNAIPIGPGGIGSGEVFVESLFILFGSRNGSEIIAVFHIIYMLLSTIGFVFYLKGKVGYRGLIQRRSDG